MQTEFVTNGVRYKWYLAGSKGASFIVFKDDKTDEQVEYAIREIKRNRDVVSIRKATKSDLVQDFWEDVFSIAEKKHRLHWSQITHDDTLLSKAMGKVSANDFVELYLNEWKLNKIQK